MLLQPFLRIIQKHLTDKDWDSFNIKGSHKKVRKLIKKFNKK